MSDSSPRGRRRVLSADELESVQRFKMPSISTSTTPQRSDAEIQALLSEAREKAQAHGYQQGLIEGQARGEAAALTTMQAERDREVAQLGEDFAVRLGALYEAAGREMARIESELADELTQFTISLASHVIQHAISIDDSSIIGVVQAGIERIREATDEITCKLHPDDHKAVTQALAETDFQGKLRLLASPSITRGGCRLETNDVMLDLTLEQRWQHALASIGHAERCEHEPGDE